MSTVVFNCPQCDEPFDCKEGEPKIPGYDKSNSGSWCLTCYPDETPINRGMMDWLNQPAFKKTDDGYEYTLPINDPICFACEENIEVFGGEIAFLGECGHYCCLKCIHEKEDEGILCEKCNITTEGTEKYAETQFGKVVKEIRRLQDRQFRELSEKVKEIDVIEAKKQEDRKNGALQPCSDCCIEQPVERLFNCNNCQKVLCGVCVVDSHQGHAVVKRLGIELDQMEQRNDKTYTENLQGLHGNLKHVQATIDEAVEKVLVAGKDCLAEILKRAKYDEALEIATAVEKAADEFEKHCEAYIPVGRKLATRLTELSERLVQEKKN